MARANAQGDPTKSAAKKQAGGYDACPNYTAGNAAVSNGHTAQRHENCRHADCSGSALCQNYKAGNARVSNGHTAQRHENCSHADCSGSALCWCEGTDCYLGPKNHCPECSALGFATDLPGTFFKHAEALAPSDLAPAYGPAPAAVAVAESRPRRTVLSPAMQALYDREFEAARLRLSADCALRRLECLVAAHGLGSPPCAPAPAAAAVAAGSRRRTALSPAMQASYDREFAAARTALATTACR
jgi:hypothetical protein